MTWHGRPILGSVLVALIAIAAFAILSERVRGSESPETNAIAVNDYETEGVQVALLSVKRISDGTVTAKWEYRNKTGEEKRLGESFKGMGWSEPFSLVYDAYLVDARNNMKYPVLKDTRGDLVAGKHPGTRKVVVLAPHKTLGEWAKFHAPPADAKKISVFIPGTQPFEDVPITE